MRLLSPTTRAVSVALLALAGWLRPLQSAADSPEPPGPVRKENAVLVGSSSFTQSFGHLIEGELERRGYQVTRKGVVGAGLARPDFYDMHQALEELPVSRDTAAVFVYLGVNDAQAVWLYPHERGESKLSDVPFGAKDWDSVYGRRTREFLERICQRGARRVVVLLPVDVNRAELQHRLERIRQLQVQAAAEASCAVAVRTAGDEGRFEVAGVPTRLPDGFHMSPLGAQIVWARIEPQVLELLAADAAR